MFFRPVAFEAYVHSPIGEGSFVEFFKLIPCFSSALQKSQCFTFDDEEREERKVGMLFGFLFLLDNEICSSELVWQCLEVAAPAGQEVVSYS